MADFLTDDDIERLIAEPKPIPDDFLVTIHQYRQKAGHHESDVELDGADGSVFQIRVRQSVFNRLDFSVILLVETKTGWFRLRRYNGLSHEHTNRLERDRFRGYHVHYATERYQRLGADEDAFAEPTDRYADVQSALECMASDCHLVGSLGGTRRLPF